MLNSAITVQNLEFFESVYIFEFENRPLVIRPLKDVIIHI